MFDLVDSDSTDRFGRALLPYGIERVRRHEHQRAADPGKRLCEAAHLGGRVQPGIDAKPEPFRRIRSEEHASELQSLMRRSYAVFCLKKKKWHRKRLNS